MSRPRFHRLTADQQNAILDAALGEFAARGFGEASLNRIIDAAHISKGAMYYYFDGKEDLYGEVIRRQIERLLQRGGPVPVPGATDSDAFWASLARDYGRVMLVLMQDPVAGALLRDWLTGTGSPSLRAAQDDAEQALMPWLLQTVAAGQRLGAVRTDLPTELLIAVALGLGQAMDTWLIAHPPAPHELDAAIGTVMALLRRALEP